MSINEASQVFRQTLAAKELLKNVQGLIGDDEQAKTDVIEGETNLFEAIKSAVDAMDECDLLLDGIKSKAEVLEVRKHQTETRRDRLKANIEQALMTLELDAPIRLPTMTLTLRKTPRKIVVTDEALIPSKFWKKKPAPAPALDKKALTDALKDEAKIPGAELDNGGLAISIRRK
ncbi:siphovirus Gp157 family protein [Roseibium algae]|uniref:Siphovirus Gp157 family protein n=1 Tax=Roseibium algae TaxID=3123038 RepID=A0ABU8TQJ1_9HYPH